MVLLLLTIIATFGMIVLAGASSNFKQTQHTLWDIEADEIARSGLAYYQVHGVPPPVNGEPPKLFLFPKHDRSLEITQEGDMLRFTGILWSGTEIRARASYRVPLWNLADLEKVP